MEQRIYWQDNKNGNFKGGYYVRNGLHESIKMFEEKGLEVIGIRISDSWNVEFICKEPNNANCESSEVEE